MNIPNYNNVAKPIFLASLIVISIVALGLLVPIADAAHPPGSDNVTKSVDVTFDAIGDIYSIRDINNPLDQVDANGDTLSTTSIQISGNTVTITVTDDDASMDFGGIDKVLAILNSTSDPIGIETVLDETGDDTGIFSGTVKIHKKITTADKLQLQSGDALTVIYEPEPQGVGRADFKFALDFLSPAGILAGFPDGTETVVMKDVFILDAAPCANDGYDILTYPIDFQAPDISADKITVKISITNAVHVNWDDEDLANNLQTDFLKVLYKKPAGGWEDLTGTDPITGFPVTTGHDITAGTHPTGTITNVLQPSTSLKDKDFIVQPGATGDVSGQYAIGIQIGCVGGGGGGLVRPGFVVNALAGANVVASLFGKGGALTDFTGGSKNAPAKPIVTSGTVDILSDENIGFLQQGVTSDSDSGTTSKSLDSTQNVVIGKDLTFKYNVFENRGPDFLVHATMYFFDVQMMDANDRINVANSETYIMYEKGKPVKVVDPYGYFEKANFELSPIDTYNAELKYDITFNKIMPESHIVLRTWDSERWTTDTLYENAIVVSENSIASTFLDTQFENPLVEEETSTKTGFPGIPLWVKNNAMWWHEKQIDDADFVAGIQYMINEEIITIPATEITKSTSEEIPSWISNVAGYWANDEIPDDQFVQAIQWLISNGLMKV